MKLKDKLFLSSKLEVRTSDIEGRGVFCIEDIKKGELIEEAHMILLDNNKWEQCDKKLSQYVLPWPELREDWSDFCDEHDGILYQHAARPVAVLGYGMIYNHADQNNIEYYIDKFRFFCAYKANRDIKAESELTINYGENYFKGDIKKK